MALIKDIGLVIRRLDYSETSQVLAVFCRETGQQRLIAKGSKRGTKSRASVGIDLLELGRLVYSRRPESDAQLSTLTDWQQVDVFPRIRRDLSAWYAAQYAADRTAQATQEADPHPDLFDALVELLASGEPALAGLTRYLVSLLGEIGLMPQLRACAGCGAPRTPATFLYFSARHGGVLCRDCEPAFVEKRRVEPAAIDAVQIFFDDLPAPPADWLLPAFDLIDYHLSGVLAKPSRIAALLRANLSRAARS